MFRLEAFDVGCGELAAMQHEAIAQDHGAIAWNGGLTVLMHPSTTGFPQPWILRARGSMQNAVYPGRQPSWSCTVLPLIRT